MAWVFGGKKFGQYTYEHWFDDETDLEVKTQDAAQQEAANEESKNTENSNDCDNTTPHKQPPLP